MHRGQPWLKKVENQSKRRPHKKDHREQPVRQRFLQPAFHPEFDAHGGVNNKSEKDNREGKHAQCIGNGPRQNGGPRAHRRAGHQRPVRVLPRAKEKENSRAGEQPLPDRGLRRVRAAAAAEPAAKIMQRQHAPARGPVKQICLAFQVVDVREVPSHESRGHQQR